MFKPSKYQQDIFYTYRTTDKNIIVQACPGSGKTTTILQLLNFVPSYRKVILLAFNKSIVEELNSKVNRPNIKISTLHSIGLGCLRQKYGSNIQIVENKSYRLIWDFKQDLDIEQGDKDFGQTIYVITKLVDYLKLHNLKGSYQDFEMLSDKYSIICTESQLEKTVSFCKLLKKYNNQSPTPRRKLMVDFSDMIYLPIQNNMDFNVYDEVFVDEVQDLNICQQLLVDKLVSKKQGRIIAVGDKYQAIYSFMGADINSFNNFSKRQDTVCLPLSVSYRCPVTICEEANNIYKNIEYSEFAEEGQVEKEGSYKQAKDGDFILCRNNLPLVEMFLQLLKEEKKAFIKDRDLGSQLLNMINTIPNTTKQEEGISILKEKLKKLAEGLENRGVKKVSKHPKYIDFSEKIAIIEQLVEHYITFESLKDKLSEICTDRGEGINLLTIHKSKGLEADNVFILRPSLIPSKYAEQEWEMEQERNLQYVMITRAKKKLIYIGDF